MHYDVILVGICLDPLHGVGHELVGVHLVEVLHFAVVKEISFSLDFLEVEKSRFLEWPIFFILFVPVKDTVLLLANIC